MMTFKQLEAVYWIVRLGSFAQAAARLHTTQSAVSKRIHELEAIFKTDLFDRSLRSARLTEKGEEMYAVAKRLLEQRDQAAEQLQRPEAVERRLRLGVTELTAMTWLPRLVARVQAFYPKVVIEPDVDSGSELREKLLADELDLAILPDTFEDARFSALRIGSLELAWMCKPGLIGAKGTLPMHELSRHRLLLQHSKSGVGMVMDKWFQTSGIKLVGAVSTNNMLALIGMTVSGLGITYLPVKCLDSMVTGGMLEVLKVSPALPDMRYVALFRAEQRSTLISSIAMLAQESCDFSRMFQMSETASGG